MMSSIEWRNLRAAVLLIMLLSVLFFLAGCSSVRAGGERISATGLNLGDMIAVVPRSAESTANQFESSLGPCIQDELDNLGIGCRVLYLHELQESAFCDYGQSEHPSCDEIMKRVTADDRKYSLTENNGIRYLVCISGNTCSTSPDIAGDGGDGFVVLLIGWDKYSKAEAEIYDLGTGTFAGSIKVSASDTGVVGIIPPFFIPAMTETKVCERFGKEIVRFLEGHEKESTETGNNEDTPVSRDQKPDIDICPQPEEESGME